MATIDKDRLIEILTETMTEHGVDKALIDGVVKDSIEQMQDEFDHIDFESEDDEDEDVEDEDD